jgi:prevent-host-death family protein
MTHLPDTDTCSAHMRRPGGRRPAGHDRSLGCEAAVDSRGPSRYHEMRSHASSEETKMPVKVSVHQLQDHLPELLDQVVKTGEEYVVQRDGKDCAVIVSARQWRRRGLGQRLDALGIAYRLGGVKQARAEQLLAAKQLGALTPAERRELKALGRECDAIMLRRAAALDKLP